MGTLKHVILSSPWQFAYLSMTAKHSFRQVNRLPLRSRKVPEVAVTGGGVCLHSGSSTGMGAGLMLNVAPEKVKWKTVFLNGLNELFLDMLLTNISQW